MLKQLKSMGIILAVLSNKAEPAVEVLCDKFFPGIFKITAGAREDFFKKPDPTRLLSILKELEVNTALSLQLDRLHQRRLVAPQRYGIVPTNFEDGEHEAGAVYAEYVTDYLSDGKPFDAYLKAKGVLQFNSVKTVEHEVKFGLNWDYTKNYGRGQVYDIEP